MKQPPKAQTPRELAIRLLERTDVIISDGRWTRGFFARNKYGHPTWCLGPSVRQWCLDGAMHKSRYEATRRYKESFIREARIIADYSIREHLNGATIIRYNDAPGRTVEHVHAAIDKAIASLKQYPQ